METNYENIEIQKEDTEEFDIREFLFCGMIIGYVIGMICLVAYLCVNWCVLIPHMYMC